MRSEKQLLTRWDGLKNGNESPQPFTFPQTGPRPSESTMIHTCVIDRFRGQSIATLYLHAFHLWTVGQNARCLSPTTELHDLDNRHAMGCFPKVKGFMMRSHPALQDF
ncbi:hypothetical protein FRB93_002231 [Tulasnella sp. JGI-2019a]|nr:hypothetical protein FRB93_002231 [Tulasnella sp. JGI-2019a]